MSEREHPVSIVRNKAVIVEQQQLGEATSLIQYQSNGHALIIGPQEEALSAASSYGGKSATVVCVDAAISKMQKRLADNGVAVFLVSALDLEGHLGAFKAVIPAATTADKPFDVAVSVYLESGFFDVVLDMSRLPLLPAHLPPFGYRHIDQVSEIPEAMADLMDMQGEFEKPRYFNYNKNLCAHSRSELKGCQQCLDVCSTGAIVSDGEGVQVNPFLCQGCGSCATVCPSGAMTYAYPRPANAIERTRAALKSAETSGLLLYAEVHEELVARTSLPDELVPLMVEEVSAFGPDFWLSVLAGYACRIILVSEAAPDHPDALALRSQIQWVDDLLKAVGVSDAEAAISIVTSSELEQHSLSPLACLIPSSWENSALKRLQPRDFATHNDKRQTLRLALDVISEQLPPASSETLLKTGSPFGHIKVDTDACTLCMACVSTCPAKALQDGQDTPALRFVESNCLQCGLCEAACPESAISLQARYTWDSVAARQINTLHEEEPFHCLVCHTPFTTKAMINTMSEKLAGHWMFQDTKAIRRLKLCGDCRVKDMFEDDAGGIDVHKIT